MSDLISRQAVMKEFSDFVRRANNSDFAETPTWNDAVSLVGSLPSAEVTLCHLDSPCEYQNADIAMPSEQPEQKSDIEEAVEYIKNAQEYLRDIGETWCANYLSDAIELLAGEKRGEER